MRERLIGLDLSHAKAFCLRLWFELTLAGRGIWIDSTLDAASQANALKWLNEIQHRVWGAYTSHAPDALAHLLDRIVSHCEQAPPLASHVRVALDRALLVVTGGEATAGASA
jgi:hypothetical protein